MLKTESAVIAAAAAATALTSKKAYAWKSSTHADIAMKGIELLSADGYEDAYELYSKYEETIVSHTQKPDYKGDFDKGKGWHYYCVTDVYGNEYKKSQSGYRMSGKNFLSPSRYCRTARTIFEDNYQSALSFFKAGETERAMQFVARCVHMIADIGCTPHTTNLTLTSVKNSKHKRYEYFTSGIFSDFKAESCNENIYRMFSEDELFGDCLNSLSESSAECYDIVVNARTESELKETVGKALCLAQQYVCAFLLRFYNDSLSGKVTVEQGGKYFIRNVLNGKYLSVLVSRNGKAYGANLTDSKNVYQSQQNCSVFTAGLCEDGSYIFTADNNRLVASKPYVITDAPKLVFGFKLGMTPNGIRLSDKAHSYNAVLSADDNKVCAKAYNPDDCSQHWIFEKA